MAWVNFECSYVAHAFILHVPISSEIRLNCPPSLDEFRPQFVQTEWQVGAGYIVLFFKRNVEIEVDKELYHRQVVKEQ